MPYADSSVFIITVLASFFLPISSSCILSNPVLPSSRPDRHSPPSVLFSFTVAGTKLSVSPALLACGFKENKRVYFVPKRDITGRGTQTSSYKALPLGNSFYIVFIQCVH